jgi:Delta7-sterol 5-desaturase
MKFLTRQFLIAFGALISNTIAFDPYGFFFPPASEGVTFHTKILHISNWGDFFLKTLLVSIGYILSYLFIGGFIEYTNPIPKTKERMASTKKQVYLGLVSLTIIVIYSIFWHWKIEQYTPFYGYYESNPVTVKNFLISLFLYMFLFDAWFYWTHRMLHLPWFWREIHTVHHQFIEPSAFAQDSVHWFEAILQGPLGHYLITLVYPVHPISLAAFGFLTSIFALLAHDGRALDVNTHIYHHFYKSCNYSLYWPFWDWICDTRHNKKKFPEVYVPTWERQKTDEGKKSK